MHKVRTNFGTEATASYQLQAQVEDLVWEGKSYPPFEALFYVFPLAEESIVGAAATGS